jgi:hypothetical protein
VGWFRSARAFAIALFAVGALALVLSFGLTPTPDEYIRDSEGHRVRIDAAVHAVDYAIAVLRIGGVIALVSGAYLIYRGLRPDRINESEAAPGNWHDPYADIPPEGGNPGPRSGIG